MFSGVGGFELGLEGNRGSKSYGKDSRSNRSEFNSSLQKDKQCSTYTCIGCSEIDKYASELLANKFPSVKNWGDATKINPSELPDFDMLCGGFPCQAFSIAGKRGGFSDTRGTLFFDIARIIKVKRPKTLLLENVKGLLNHNKGETFRTIIQTLSELGYDVQWMVLNSKFHGVPQNRERVFIIGNLRGTSRPEILPFRQTDSEINDLQGQQSNTITARYEQAQATGSYIIKGEQHAQVKTHSLYPRSSKTNKGGTGHLTKEDGQAYSMDTGNMQAVESKMKIRRLTPTECEKLQGFPEGWTEGFSDTQRYKMMGNAVTVNVIRAIAQKLGQTLTPSADVGGAPSK